jgi:hypothetical protein
VQERVEQGVLAPATAYEIGKAGDRERQVEIADRVVAGGLSRSEAIEAVRAATRHPAKPGKGRRGIRAGKAGTARTLRAAGCRVTVEHRKGVDDDLLAAALREALEQVEAMRTHAA